MTPDQRKRLEAVAAALAPCFGCLVEDEADADQDLASLQPDRVAHIRAVHDSLRQELGQYPAEGHTDEEEAAIEARRAALRSQLEELAQLRKLLGKRGAAAAAPPAQLACTASGVGACFLTWLGTSERSSNATPRTT